MWSLKDRQALMPVFTLWSWLFLVTLLHLSVSSCFLTRPPWAWAPPFPSLPLFLTTPWPWPSPSPSWFAFLFPPHPPHSRVPGPGHSLPSCLFLLTVHTPDPNPSSSEAQSSSATSYQASHIEARGPHLVVVSKTTSSSPCPHLSPLSVDMVTLLETLSFILV